MNHAVTLLEPPHDAWIHIFPEGRIYQAPDLAQRYYKFGVSKLILEPKKTPIVIPMFHSGMEQVMREYHVPPQFIPSTGKDLHIGFGDPIPLDTWRPLRQRWRKHPVKGALRHLRLETTEIIRDAVNDVRASMGFPPEPPNSNDPKTFPPIVTPARTDVEGWFSRTRK